MSDESGDMPAPDPLFPDEDPIFLDDEEPTIPEGADLPPEPETGDPSIGPPAGLSSARGLKPGEFHRPPPDLSSLPSIASYHPALVDTGDEDDDRPVDAPVPPAEDPIEPAVADAVGHEDRVDQDDEGVVEEPGEPAGLPSARALKPGEFHRLPPQLSSLPSVAAYQPAEMDPIDDGEATFIDQPDRPDDTGVGAAAHAGSGNERRPELQRAENPESEDAGDAAPTHPLAHPDDELERRGFDELPVYPPRPDAASQPPPPPRPSPPLPAQESDRPGPVDSGPPPPPPKIRVGPPPPAPGPPAAPAATSPAKPPDTIAPPPDDAGSADLPVRDSPPAPPPIRTEIPARPQGASRAPTAPLPVVPPPPVVSAPVAHPPQDPPPRPQPELTMEDLIAASVAQNEDSDTVDWFVDAQVGRSPSKSRRIGVIVAVAAAVTVLLGVGAFLRHRGPDTTTAPGSNESVLLAVDPDGTPEAPYGIGDWAEIGNGWWMALADAEVEAEALLQDSADFNPTPRNGGYAMADLDLRYVGTEPTTLFDLAFDAVAPSGRTHSSFDCRATEPHPLDRRVDIFPGAVVTGDECFDVAVADRTGLLLAVSSGPGSEPVHFSFTARGNSETSPPEPPPAVESTGIGTRGAPVPLGEAADIGGGWLLRVDEVTKDAERDLVGANPFNEPPINGSYALAGLTAVYTGPGETDALDVRFNAVGPHNVGYSSAGCAAAEAEPFPWASSVSNRDQLTGQVCFDIDPEDTGELALYARGTPDALPVFFSTGA